MSAAESEACNKGSSEDCGQPVVAFRKSKRRGANIRKRVADSDDVDIHSGTGAAGSKDVAKTETGEGEAGADYGTAAVDGSNNGSGSGRPAKLLKTSGISSSTRQTRQRASSPSQVDNEIGVAADQQPAVEYHFKRAMDSTRTVEPEAQDTHSDKAENAKEAIQKRAVEATEDAGDAYKGKAGYTNRASGMGSRRAGPFKAPTNVRSTSVFDYQPNVCKDYKETGYCGYGDSCIFLHDRGTYKSGWQLEKEFEEAQAGVKRENPKLWTIDHDEEPETDAKAGSEELPFACLICRKPFQKPVVTKCQHYFCEACALKNYRKTPKCFACGAATGGVFRPAKNLAGKS
ncbi:RNA-splicing factor [Coemansia sp. RSA 2598]|nr:RNA-splicing factor [Coemansia sp. RSA 2598]